MNKQLNKTRVYGIKDAAKELSRRSTVGEAVEEPVDICGIVSEIFEPDSTTKGKRCLRIIDSSCSAFVTVVFSDGQSVQVGDVIRFNRVGLKRDKRLYSRSTPTDTKGQDIAHFSHMWDDPEAGRDWFRLGHISIVDGSLVSASPRDVVPASMQTDEEQIERLADWYLTSCAFKARTPLLSQIPHRPRTIEEMTSCVGITGEIVASVEQVVESPILPLTHSTRKRKRGIVPHSSMGCMVLSEFCGPHNSRPPNVCSQQFATLVDLENRFLSHLRYACDSKLPVRISHLRSEKARQVPSRPAFLNSNGEDVILLITKASRVTVLSPNEDKITRSSRQADLSQRFALACSSQTRHQQQHFALPTTATQDASVIREPESVRLEGHIVSIRSDDNKITFNLPSSSSQALGGKHAKMTPGTSWRTANTISFCLVLGATTLGGEVEVKATRSIMRKLSGENIRQNKYDTQEGDVFLAALLHQETRLRWELRRKDDHFEVENVSLHQID